MLEGLPPVERAWPDDQFAITDTVNSGAGSVGGNRTRAFRIRRDQEVSATLKLTHKAIGAEVRRGAYEVMVDGERVGSVEMNKTTEIAIDPGRHGLQVRSGRKSSRVCTFEAADGEIVAYRCTGKRFLPIFLASFVSPGLALALVREGADS